MITHRLIVPHPRRAALLLAVDSGGAHLPWFAADDRHTAEVDYINAAARADLGLETTVLRSLRHDLDRHSGAVTRVHVFEVQGDPTVAHEGLRWCGESEVGALRGAEAVVVEEWRAGRRRAPVDGRGWTQPGWFTAVCDWIERTLRGTGVAPPIEVVQVRAWPSSCVLLARTPSGDFYCKALPESGRRECTVTAFLAEHFAAAVPPLVTCDLERRWLLMRAVAGPKLEDLADSAAWERAAAMYARLQVACIGHAEGLRGLGSPERGLAALDAVIEPLVADDAALREGDTDGLSPSEVDRLRALVPALRRRCAALHDAAIPLTLEHGDLWPGNFLVDGDHSVLIDWEDVAIGHPFLSLAPLLVGLSTYQPALNTAAVRQRMEDAYLAPFSAVAAPELLRRALQLAAPLSFVDMAIRYRAQPPSVAALHPWMRDLVPQTLRLALAAVEPPSPARERAG